MRKLLIYLIFICVPIQVFAQCSKLVLNPLTGQLDCFPPITCAGSSCSLGGTTTVSNLLFTGTLQGPTGALGSIGLGDTEATPVVYFLTAPATWSAPTVGNCIDVAGFTSNIVTLGFTACSGGGGGTLSGQVTGPSSATIVSVINGGVVATAVGCAATPIANPWTTASCATGGGDFVTGSIGYGITFTVTHPNSASATLNVDGQGAFAVYEAGGLVPVAAGDFQAGGQYTLIWDGNSHWEQQTPPHNSTITIGGTSVSLGGSTSSFPSPGAIGGATPSTGLFTTLGASGLLTASAAGAASTPGLTVTGAPYTAGSATTNFPQLYVNDGTGPTTFSTTGTEIGANSPSGFTGNFLDFHVNGGGSVASINYLGAFTLSSGLTTGSGASGGPANGSISVTEGSLVGTPTAGNDYIYGNSTNHCWALSANGSVEGCIPSSVNGNNPIVWNWAETTNSQTALTIGETTAASGTGDILLQLNTLATSTSTPLTINNLGASTKILHATGSSGTTEFDVYTSGFLYVNTAIGIGIGTASCSAGTANVLCVGSGSAPTAAAGVYQLFPSTSAIAMWQTQDNGGGTANVVETQPGFVNSTGNTGNIGTSTLCASSAGACNKAGQYHVHVDMYETGTACATVGTGTTNTPTVTYTDVNGNVHSILLPMLTNISSPALVTTFIPATSLTTPWASGDLTFWTNGSVIQYATTGYTACTIGTFTFEVDAAVTRLQ